MNADERRSSSRRTSRAGSRGTALLAYLLSSVLVCVSAARGQRDPSSLYGKDSLQGVYVRDSAVAVEKFALAERMERLNEWNKAAAVYQEIVEEYADRVLPSRVDEKNQIVQYTSAAAAAQERLAKWPAQGLAVYRNLYETAAATVLEAAPDDPATLHRVCKLYFVTDTAKSAGIKLLDVQILGGEFASAAWLADRLLSLHPGLGDDRPAVLYRAAIAHHFAGNAEQAAARSKELKDDFPAATALIRGKEAVLADAIVQDLASAGPLVAAASGDSWPMSFGSPARDRAPAVSGGMGGARLFSVPIVRTPPQGQRGAFKELENMDRRSRQEGFNTGILPAIDRGELYFQDNARLYAVSIDSGLPLPGWAETYSGDRGGVYTVPKASATPRGAQAAVCLTDDAVLAVMGQTDRVAMLYAPGAARDSRLVCLDRRTGRERWVFSSRNAAQAAAAAAGAGAGGAGGPAAAQPGAEVVEARGRFVARPANDSRAVELVGTPLVVGDRVYVAAEAGAGMQFEQCEVLAIDLASGRLLWRSYIASASTSMQPWDVDPTSQPDTIPQLSYADGRLYVCTNLGAVASLDGYDGSVVWLNLYPRDLSEFNRIAQFRMQMGRPDADAAARGRPWAHNPVILSGGRAFVLPRSSDSLFVYDAGTGAELKRIPLRPLDKPDTLVGVAGERVVVSGPKKLACIDWTRVEAGAPLDDYRLWAKEFERSGAADDITIRGRPFLSADSVYVPVQWKLFRIALRNGVATSSYPPDDKRWDSEEGPGNVVVTQDHLVIAGSERVAVYTDLTLARSKLDREVAAAPQSPAPRLRYAEVMFVAGQYEVAAQKLDEAMTLLGGAAALGGGDDRDRLFNSAVNFARKLMEDASPSSSAATRPPAAVVDGFLDRAAVAASTPAQQVSYRVTRARWARSQRDDAGELQLLQEILSDPAYRAEPVAQADGSALPTTAAYYAQRAIGELIARNPRAYEPVEQRAQAELDRVIGSGDAEQLIAVAQVYPNSNVATRAMLAAAEAYETADNARQAAAVVRVLLTRPLDPAQRLSCLEALARNYLRLPNRLDVAAARLAQAAQLDPAGKLSRPLPLPGGKVLTGVPFAEAAAALRQLRRESARAALPRVGLPENPPPGSSQPVPVAFRQTRPPIEGIKSLLRPSAGPSGVRYDRIVAYRPGTGVMVFDVNADQPRYVSAAASSEQPAGCAWVGQNLLYYTAGRIVFVKGDDSGESMWETSLLAVPMPDVISAEEDAAIASIDDADEAAAGGGGGGDAAARGNVVVNGGVILRGNGGLVVRGGQVRVLVQPDGQRIIVRNGRPQLLGGRVNNAAIANALIDPAVPPGPDEQILHVRCLSDRAIVATSQGRVFAIDLADGQPLWQARPTDRVIERLIATDDFVAAVFNDDTSMQLVALDAAGGQTVLRRVFSRETLLPVNFALAPDGKLIWLTNDTLVAKDLFDPSDRPTFVGTYRASANGEGVFGVEPRSADQIVIADNIIAVVTDGGQFVRQFSLEDGREVMEDARGLDARVARKLRTDAQPNDWSPQLVAMGSRLYAVGAFTIHSHDLEQPRLEWSRQVNSDNRWRTRESALTSTHLILFEEALPSRQARLRQVGQPAPQFRISAYSRAVTGTGNESGLLEHQFEVNDPAGISAYQLVSGGVAYLAGDKLHVLAATGSQK